MKAKDLIEILKREPELEVMFADHSDCSIISHIKVSKIEEVLNSNNDTKHVFMIEG